MTAVDVDGSAMRYCHVPDVGSKTWWITGSVDIEDAVLYVTRREIRWLVGMEHERGEDAWSRRWTDCPFCDWLPHTNHDVRGLRKKTIGARRKSCRGGYTWKSWVGDSVSISEGSRQGRRLKEKESLRHHPMNMLEFLPQTVKFRNRWWY